jgi:Rhodanese-like domain
MSFRLRLIMSTRTGLSLLHKNSGLTESRRTTDTDERTSYLLDIRSAEEYAAAHVPGAISPPGGQLLAVSHRTAATRGARLVLVYDDGTRVP